ALPAYALAWILRFDEGLGRCESLDETLRCAVGQGLRSFGAQGALIALLGYRVRLEHVHSSPGYEDLVAQCSGLPLDSASPLAQVIRTGKAIMANPPPPVDAPLSGTGPARWAVLPIAGSRGVIGAL